MYKGKQQTTIVYVKFNGKFLPLNNEPYWPSGSHIPEVRHDLSLRFYYISHRLKEVEWRRDEREKTEETQPEWESVRVPNTIFSITIVAIRSFNTHSCDWTDQI